jgi:hypothetical protein
VTVVLSGPGINKTARTGPSGTASPTLRPGKPGIVTVDLRRAKACSVRRVGIVATTSPPVTG